MFIDLYVCFLLILWLFFITSKQGRSGLDGPVCRVWLCRIKGTLRARRRTEPSDLSLEISTPVVVLRRNGRGHNTNREFADQNLIPLVTSRCLVRHNPTAKLTKVGSEDGEIRIAKISGRSPQNIGFSINFTVEG